MKAQRRPRYSSFAVRASDARDTSFSEASAWVAVFVAGFAAKETFSGSMEPPENIPISDRTILLERLDVRIIVKP
jgi:hypothetical protein